jgi:ATP-binding cassette subfamily B protein
MDGVPVDRIPVRVRNASIATVSQNITLFSGSIRDNLTMWNRAVSEQDMIQAAKDACIHDNIMDFPEDYKTMVGERGVTLSGGQKQRSSIARALLKDAPVLILDDSLSAVDTDTEEKILDNLLRTRRDKTTILVAHRISTLQHADHIVVLEDGAITEYGTHEELLSLDGFYAQIFKKQQLEQQLQAL